MSSLRQQDFLQTKDKSKKNQGNLIFIMKQDKIQELQFLEQTMQNILLQKQTFQMELSETQSALNEIRGSKDDVYKIIGQMMIKSEKKKILEELENKEKIISLRLSSIEKQEDSMMEKMEKIREEVIDSQHNWKNREIFINVLHIK